MKLAAMRQLAPELLVTAKTQRWTPEELLRTLVEAEITARDASNARTRMKTAAFPVLKTLDEFDVSVSSIPTATVELPRLAGMDRCGREPVPGRTGRHRQKPPARRARRRRGPGRTPGPLLHRRRARRNPLPRPGRQLRRQDPRHPAPQRPDHRRRGRLRTPGRHRHPTTVPPRRGRLRTQSPRDRLPLAVRVLGPVPARTHHRGQPARPATPPCQRRNHRGRLLPDARSPHQRRHPPEQNLIHPEGWGLLLGHQRGPQPGR